MRIAMSSSGHLGAAARAGAQATETAAGLTPHHPVRAAGWQLILASVTGTRCGP
jgi:hypothetical protein